MTTLITGAAGRVGRELIALRRARGDRLRALVLPNDPGREALASSGIEIVEGTLNDRSAVSEAVAGVCYVAHLAATMMWGEGADRSLFEQNIAGTFNLLDALVEQHVQLQRFFLASSDEIYPSLKANYTPINEQHPRNPYSFYGLTKETNECFAFYYQRAHDIPVTVARFALVARTEEILRPDGWSGRFFVRRSDARSVRGAQSPGCCSGTGCSLPNRSFIDASAGAGRRRHPLRVSHVRCH